MLHPSNYNKICKVFAQDSSNHQWTRSRLKKFKAVYTPHGRIKSNACKIVELPDDISTSSSDSLDSTNDSFSTTSSSSFTSLSAEVRQRQESFNVDSYTSCPTVYLNPFHKDNTHTAHFSRSYTREIDLDIDSGAVVSTYPFAEDLIDFNVNRRATIRTADGTKHLTLGSGTLVIEVTDDNLNKQILSIKDVHVAPFVKSLCSVRHLLNYVDDIKFNDMNIVINNVKYSFRWERYGYYWKVRVLSPTYYEDYGDVTSRTTSATPCFCYA